MGRQGWIVALGAVLCCALPGSALAALTPSPTPLAFGAHHVGTATTQTVTFTSGLPAGADFSSTPPQVSGADFAIAAGGTCPPGALTSTCTVNVTFTPGAAVARGGTLTYSGASVTLTGAGTLPGPALDTAALAFPPRQTDQPPSDPQAFTLSNGGNENLNVTGVAAAGDTGDFFVGATAAGCAAPMTLVPGASCRYNVVFRPTAAGARSLSLSFTYDGNSPVAASTVGFSGTGVDPPPPPAPALPGLELPPPTVDEGPGGGSTATGDPLVSIRAPKARRTVRRTVTVRRKGKRVKRTRIVTFKGLASDTHGLRRVEIALTRGKGSKCRVFDGRKSLKKGSCAKPRFTRVRLDDFDWSYRLPSKARLSAGTYTLVARSIDLEGNDSEHVSVDFTIK
jgi:hypothetical protein